MRNFTNTTSQNTTIDMMLMQWLELGYNHEAISSLAKTVLIVLYVFSVTLTIIGNTIVIVIITRALARRIHISMYQLNMALADLLMSLFCVPFTFAQAQIGYWPIGSVSCPIVLFLQLCFVSVSAYTNMAIGIERLFGVFYPLTFKLTNNQRKLIVVGVWCVATIIALPEVAVGRSESQEFGNVTHHLCNEYWSTPGQKENYTLAVFILVLVIPLSTLTCTYTCVAYRLWIRKTPGNADIRRDRKRIYSKKKVTRMLMIVVALFSACWLPLHLFNVLVDFHPAFLHTASERTIQIIFFTCHWVAMSHAFINPIIYVTTDEDFRDKAWKLITCRKGMCTKVSHASFTGSFRHNTNNASLRRENAEHGLERPRKDSTGSEVSHIVLKQLPTDPMASNGASHRNPRSSSISGPGRSVQGSMSKYQRVTYKPKSNTYICRSISQTNSEEVLEMV